MISSPGFGSSAQDKRPYRTRFRYGSACYWLNLPYTTNSLAHSTKGTRSSAEADSHSLKVYNFTIYFTPLPGVLFTFPSRYLFTIDLVFSLALDGGPPRFKPDFTCPTLLRILLLCNMYFAYRAITSYGGSFQNLPLYKLQRYWSPTTPRPKPRFGLFPFRSSLLRESLLISFFRLLRYFSSPTFLHELN